MGLRNPSPTSDSTRMTPSITAFTRGYRGRFSVRVAARGAAGMGAGGTAASAGACGLGLLADDIAALDLLLALEAERELLDVGVRLAAVVLDAVDEVAGRRAIS